MSPDIRPMCFGAPDFRSCTHADDALESRRAHRARLMGAAGSHLPPNRPQITQRAPDCHSASSAEAVRKQCGSSAGAVRKSRGSSAEVMRNGCGGNSEKMRKSCGGNAEWRNQCPQHKYFEYFELEN